MNGAERRWFEEHGEELVDTMAAPYGPDVVALLKNETTYGVIGDHGGHQRLIQRIPLVFSWSGLKSGSMREAVRLVDVLPTILDVMNIPLDPDDLDGEAVPLALT